MPKRVNVYVDGFNLYHGIDAFHDDTLKWLNLWKLGESFCRDDEALQNVHYFTAFATWKPLSFRRHEAYVKALRARGVNVVIGNFKKKISKCVRCGSTWTSHEEKETDVHIAAQIIDDAHRKNYDHAILVTGDSDQAPTVKLAKIIHPSAEFSIWTPPNRFCGCDSLGSRKEIRRARLLNCLLPERITDLTGVLVVQCPEKYRMKRS